MKTKVEVCKNETDAVQLKTLSPHTWFEYTSDEGVELFIVLGLTTAGTCINCFNASYGTQCTLHTDVMVKPIHKVGIAYSTEDV